MFSAKPSTSYQKALNKKSVITTNVITLIAWSFELDKTVEKYLTRYISYISTDWKIHNTT